MRNIFLFIRQYFNLICFLCLQVFCISMIVHYSKYHDAVASSYLNQVTGKINTQYNKIQYYFQLSKTNDSLVKANERLYNKLKEDFILPDSTVKKVIDTIRIDSAESFRMYRYINAKVIYNSVTLPNNFLEIAKGSDNGIRKECAVIDPTNNLVGRVVDMSNGYAVIMSMLNKDFKVSGFLKNCKDVGFVTWDGKDPQTLLLTDIKKSAKVAIGDSVLTSGLGSVSTFPRGILIGVIKEIVPDKSSNSYFIKLRTAANLTGLEYVYVIDNLQKENIKALLDKATKQNAE